MKNLRRFLTQDLLRWPFILWLEQTKQMSLLIERTNYTVIGFTGHVSAVDERIAAERHLKPLNRFERWLTKPWIDVEVPHRRQCWREAMLEATGEDIRWTGENF